VLVLQAEQTAVARKRRRAAGEEVEEDADGEEVGEAASGMFEGQGLRKFAREEVSNLPACVLTKPRTQRVCMCICSLATSCMVHACVACFFEACAWVDQGVCVIRLGAPGAARLCCVQGRATLPFLCRPPSF